MREVVGGWLKELGFAPEPWTEGVQGPDWAWKVEMPPDSLGVVVIGRAVRSEVVLEVFDVLDLEALGSRRGADVAHRVRASIQRREASRIETEIHRNGKAWLRIPLPAQELRKDMLARELRALQAEHDLLRRWVADALATGALPP